MTFLLSRFAAAAVAFLVSAGAVAAQQPAAQPSAARFALAKEAVLNSGIVRTFDSVIDPMIEQVRKINVTRPEIRKDLDAVLDGLRPEMNLQKQQMINAAARIFATQLTETELADVGTFFKSPSGRRYVELQPIMLEDVIKEMGTWTQSLSEYVMIRTRAEMGKRGHRMN